MRWTALVLLASAMFFAYIFVDVLSPLQGLLQTQRGWDPDAYGHFAGSEPFLNVFVFFLIFAGIILDKMGVRFTAVLSGVVMVLGAAINWYAVTDLFDATHSICRKHGGTSPLGMTECPLQPSSQPSAS